MESVQPYSSVYVLISETRLLSGNRPCHDCSQNLEGKPTSLAKAKPILLVKLERAVA